MNILELSAYFYPHKGGIETVIYNLAKEWTKNKSCNVTVIASDQGADVDFCSADGIKVHYLRSFKLLGDVIFLSLCRKIRQLNKKQKFDIALIHHPHPFVLFCGAYSCKKSNIPYCVHMHGREVVLSGCKGLLSTIYNQIFLKYVLSNSRKIFICVDKIQKQSKLLRSHDHKTITIPHGIDLSEFDFHKSGPKSQLKTKLGFKDKKMIFSVGVLRGYKQLDILIKAMPAIIKSVPSVLLVIAGNGPEETKLKALCDQLTLNKNVRFIAGMPDEQKYLYYKAADLFVLPSATIMESFGLVAFESLALKTPAIVTSGAGISEVFKKERIGLVAKPFSHDDLAEKAISLLKNNALSDKLADQAYRVIKSRYQWKSIADQYLKVFAEIKGAVVDLQA